MEFTDGMGLAGINHLVVPQIFQLLDLVSQLFQTVLVILTGQHIFQPILVQYLFLGPNKDLSKLKILVQVEEKYGLQLKTKEFLKE